MTKKEFKERCSFHLYTNTRERHNVIYYDWKVTEDGRGFKYGMAARAREGLCTKKQLLDYLYNWVINDDLNYPYFVRTRFAETDAERFKTPLALNF